MGTPEQKADGWVNPVTGFGTEAADPTVHSSFVAPPRLSLEECSALYNYNTFGGIVADAPAQHMIRGPITIEPLEADPKLLQPAKDLTRRFADLRIKKAVQEGHAWGRAFGGALLVFGLDNLKALEEPAPPGPLLFDWIEVYDRRVIQPSMAFQTGPDRGKVSRYQINPPSISGSSPFVVHRTRVVRFGGQPTPPTERAANQDWDLSIYERGYEAIQGADEALKAGRILMTSAGEGVFAMSGVVAGVASKDQEIISNRLALMKRSRSVANCIVVDPEHGESYTRVNVSFAGAPDIIDRNVQMVCANYRIPLTVLLGQAPAGLNATGDNDLRNWYDGLEAYREEEVFPLLDRFLEIEATRMGLDPKLFRVVRPSFWQETPNESAARKKLVLEGVALALDRQVITSDEARQSLYGGKEFSDEIKLSKEPTIPQGEILPYPTEPAPTVTTTGPTITLAPTDIATVVFVDEARESVGLGKFEEAKRALNGQGALTISEYKALNAPTIAAAAAAGAGTDPTTPTIPTTPTPTGP